MIAIFNGGWRQICVHHSNEKNSSIVNGICCSHSYAYVGVGHAYSEAWRTGFHNMSNFYLAALQEEKIEKGA